MEELDNLTKMPVDNSEANMRMVAWRTSEQVEDDASESQEQGDSEEN